MSPPHADLLPQILETCQETAAMVGELRGRFDASERATETQRRRCAEEFSRLGRIGETSYNHIAAVGAASKTRATMWAQLLALIGLAVGIAGAFRLASCSTATTEQRRDAASFPTTQR